MQNLKKYTTKQLHEWTKNNIHLLSGNQKEQKEFERINKEWKSRFKKSATLLVISDKMPLSNQLKNITGDNYNSGDFDDTYKGSNYSVATHNKTGKNFIVIPMRIYENYNSATLKKELDAIKFQHKFSIIRKSKLGLNGHSVNSKLKKETFKTPDGKPLEISRAELLKQSKDGLKIWKPLLKEKGWVAGAKENIKFWEFMLKQAQSKK